MPSLTATTTTTEEVQLDPRLRRKLVTKLQAYAKKTAEIKKLTAEKDKLVSELGALRDESGEVSLRLEGLGTITLVAGTQKKFNPKKFEALGGDLAIYNQAFEEKPKKSYEKITLPGERASAEDDQ